MRLNCKITFKSVIYVHNIYTCILSTNTIFNVTYRHPCLTSVSWKFNLRTCHVPMLETLWPNGRWKVKHSLKASLRISMRLFIRAQNAAMGKADEKRTTYPSWMNISKWSANVPSYCNKETWQQIFCDTATWVSTSICSMIFQHGIVTSSVLS